MTIVEVSRRMAISSLYNIYPYVYQFYANPDYPELAGFWTDTLGVSPDSLSRRYFLTGLFRSPNVRYNKALTLDQAIDTVGYWFWDNETQTGTVHLEHDVTPYLNNFIATYAFGFTDERQVYIDDVSYRPLIKSVPRISQSQDLQNYSVPSYLSGSVIFNNMLDNGDGALDLFIGEKLNGNDIDIFTLDITHGEVNYTREQLIPQAAAYIEDYDFTLKEVDVRIQDRRKSQNVNIPQERFSIDDYADIEEHLDGKVIPILYGTPADIPAICVNGKLTSGDVEYRAALLLADLGTVQVDVSGNGDWNTVTVSSSDLETGSFVLSDFDGRSSTGRYLSCRLLAPTGIEATIASDVIIDLNSRFLGVDYNDSNYDVAEVNSEAAGCVAFSEGDTPKVMIDDSGNLLNGFVYGDLITEDTGYKFGTDIGYVKYPGSKEKIGTIDGFTITFKLKRDNTPVVSTEYILAPGDTLSTPNWLLAIADLSSVGYPAISLVLSFPSVSTVFPIPIITDNEWHSYGVRYEARAGYYDISYCYDNVFGSRYSYLSMPIQLNNDLMIGNRLSETRQLNASLKDVSFFNSAITLIYMQRIVAHDYYPTGASLYTLVDYGKNPLSKIAYFIDSERKLADAIVDIQNGANVGFRYEILPDGRRTVRVDNEDRELSGYISNRVIKNRDEIPVKNDISTLAAEIVVGYNKEYSSGNFSRIVDTTQKERVELDYRQAPRFPADKELITLLTEEPDALERVQYIIDRFSYVRGVVELDLMGSAFINARIYDIYEVELTPASWVNGSEIVGREYYGIKKIKIIETEPDLRLMTNMVRAVIIN